MSQVLPVDGYKSVWEIKLEHVRTGKHIALGKTKGASNIWLDMDLLRDKAAMADVKFLLELLLCKNCPHPYDGTVAGSVA